MTPCYYCGMSEGKHLPECPLVAKRSGPDILLDRESYDDIVARIRNPRPPTAMLVALLALGACHQQVNWLDDPPWDHTPLTVDYSAMGPVFDSSFSSALTAWNYATGCTVAVKVTSPTSPDVVISPYDGTACGQDASLEGTHDATAGTWRCSPTHAEVHFRVMTDIRSVFVIAEHELGHVLGLAHDRSSLMMAAPALYEPQEFAGRVNLMPLPSDADGAAVGKRYCR